MIEKERLIAACRQTATPEVVAHIQRYGDHIVRAYNELGAESVAEPTIESIAEKVIEPIAEKAIEPIAEKAPAKSPKGGK